MSAKKPLGDPRITEKRIVANPRYEHVPPTVDSGVNVNVVRELRSTEVSVKQKQDELFRRVRPSTIANFVERKIVQAQNAHEEDMDDGLDPETRQQIDEYVIPKAPQKEFLILDLREREEYEKCHIYFAMHYPVAMLSRSMNQFTKEILSFKNQTDKYIVLYDLDEELAVGRAAANVMFQKGIDNVLVLSGGLKEFVQGNSHLILGESPVPIVEKQHQSARVLARRANVNSACTASTMATSVASSHKPKSLASSLARRGPSVNAWH